MAEKPEDKVKNAFQNFYGVATFQKEYNGDEKFPFKSKADPSNYGSPDFFLEKDDYIIVVECKKKGDFKKAQKEVKEYINDISNCPKAKIGIAYDEANIEYWFYHPIVPKGGWKKWKFTDLISLSEIDKQVKEELAPKVSKEYIISQLDMINTKIHTDTNIEPKNRLFFVGAIIIALEDAAFLAAFDKEKDIKNINTKLKQIIEAKFTAVGKYSATSHYSFLDNVTCNLESYKQIIKTIVDTFSVYSFATKYGSDVLGEVYNKFKKYADKQKGIVLTPNHIVNFMIELAEFSQDSVVLDLCMGSGTFLTNSFGKLLSLNTDPTKIDDIKTKQLLGVEKSDEMYAICLLNMLMRGDGRSNLYYGDSTTNFEIENKTFFCDKINVLKPKKCLMNPPYEENQAIIFIERGLELLENEGKLVVICPNNTFIKKENKSKTANLLKNNTIELIVKVPNCFKGTRTSVDPAIFVFKKGISQNNKDIKFYDLTDDGWTYSADRKGDRQKSDTKYNEAISNIQNTIGVFTKPFSVESITFIPQIKFELNKKEFSENHFKYLCSYLKTIEIQENNICIDNWKSFNFFDIFDRNAFYNGQDSKMYSQIGNIPLIGASRVNNGIIAYIDTGNKKFDGNKFLTLGKVGDDGTFIPDFCFYQKNDFFALSTVFILTLKEQVLTEELGLILSKIVSKSLNGHFNQKNQMSISKLGKLKIWLPAKNDEIDWDYFKKLDNFYTNSNIEKLKELKDIIDTLNK